MLVRLSQADLASKADFRIYLVQGPQVRLNRQHVYTIETRHC